jgi:hypothetical protein
MFSVAVVSVELPHMKEAASHPKNVHMLYCYINFSFRILRCYIP